METTATPETSTTPVPLPLTDRELNRAATNSPVLAAKMFILGARQFPVCDLGYDDYLAFITLLQPLLDMILASIRNHGQELDMYDGFSIKGIVSYCGKDLPQMVQICLKQTNPTITVDEIKALGKDPFALADIVLQQIEQNQMIKRLMDFFGRALQLLTQMGLVKSSETPS